MRTRDHILIRAFGWPALLIAVLLLLLLSLGETAHAQDFGSGAKPGSVLFYNIYTSSSWNTAASDTLVSVTNTSATDDIRVHFFFVDSFSCQVADSFLYLTKSQTTRFLSSDVDPDVRGYMIAVAVDENGIPKQHNYLIGSLKVKQALGPTSSSTHSFDLQAVAFAKLNNQTPALSAEGITTQLIFDGGASASSYEQLPGEVAIDNFESPATADTRMVVYSPTTNLYGPGESGGRLFVIYFDELENPFSAMVGMNCWLQGRLTMIRNLPLRIAAGQTGWARIVGYRNDVRIPLLGSVIRAAELSGGHNLHHLSPFPSFTITLPVFPPGV
jgi:hypothetical protein